MVAFNGGWKKSWNDVVNFTLKEWNRLPSGIKSALQSVINVMVGAIRVITDLLSYLNPWAHHSPSLVENVTTGMNVIAQQFARIGPKISGPIKRAYADIKRFGEATAKFSAHENKIQTRHDVKVIRKTSPAAVDEYKQLGRDAAKLTGLLGRLSVAITKQQNVVDGLTAALKLADAELKKQSDELDRLQKIADGYSTKLDEANGRLDKFANTPIKGMRAMSDAIFENDHQIAQAEDRAHARGAFGQARVGNGHWVDDRADYPCLSEAATVSTPMLPGS